MDPANYTYHDKRVVEVMLETFRAILNKQKAETGNQQNQNVFLRITLNNNS